VIVVLLILLSHDGVQGLQLDKVVPSLLLLPQDGEPLLGVAWTLEHEALFYLAFALAILWRPIVIPLVLVGLSLTTAGQFGVLPGHFSEFLAAPYHLEFLLGILSALTVLRLRFPLPRLLATLGVAAFIATGLAENAGFFAEAGLVSVLLFGSSSAAILVGAATAERIGTLRIGGIGALLGAASYSIYLTHTVTIGLTSHLMAKLGVISLLPDWAMLCIVVCAAGGVGIVFHWFVERPLGLALRRLANTWRKRREDPMLQQTSS
jgi:exopolysaccharide production protein ExoZ